MMIRLDSEDGKALVDAARRAAESSVNNMPFELKLDSKFDYESGVFVTITRRGALRGCIGYISGKNLPKALADAAASAVCDPRFAPVTPDELDKLEYEVTILSAPEPLAGPRYTYPQQIRLGRDGIIVRRDTNSGLLLPQVATDNGWDAAEFLRNTCTKAGLKEDAWMREGTAVMRFEGSVFSERSS